MLKIVTRPICTIPGYDGYIPAPEEGSFFKIADGTYMCTLRRDARTVRALAHLLPRDASSGYILQSASTRTDSIRRHITTHIDPKHIRSEDFIDVSGICLPIWHLRAPNISASSLLFYSHPRGRPLAFPLGTHGFIYYYRGDLAHPAGAQVRFRVTANDRPESFATGHDLLLPNGLPWA